MENNYTQNKYYMVLSIHFPLYDNFIVNVFAIFICERYKFMYLSVRVRVKTLAKKGK